MSLDIKKIRNDFPILSQKVYNQPLIYLDNGATTQKPSVVIETMEQIYSLQNSSIHRGIHYLSEQMTEAYEETGGCMVAAMRVPEDKTPQYGILDVEADGMDRRIRVKGMVEKPKLGQAPSDLAVIGRYILTPDVMNTLNQAQVGVGGEIQLTDAIANEITQGRPVTGYRFEGQRFDCGSKAGFLQATVSFALARPDLSDEFGRFLSEIVPVARAAE